MKKTKKKDITRSKILAAARKVFSMHSYSAGSIRMIADAGGFDFGLIRYHFPSKADLFETVMQQACEDLKRYNERAMEGMAQMTTEEGFSLYLDRYLQSHYDHPEILRILMNNVYRPGKAGIDIPGYHYLPSVLSESREFIKKVFPAASQADIDRFSDSLGAQVLMFVGASSCQAEMLDMNPESKKYRTWVKETLIYIFLPHLKRLLFR